jgi:hypothetical protein
MLTNDFGARPRRQLVTLLYFLAQFFNGMNEMLYGP